MSGPARSLIPIAAVLAIAAAGPWAAPFDPGLQEDVAGARFLPPLARAHALVARGDPDRIRIVTDLTPAPDGYRFLRAGSAGAVGSRDLIAPPAPRLYLLGTDGLGRDLASRLLFGVRRSVGIAVASVLVALVLGVTVGGTAGLTGGWIDAVLMRAVDALMSIPRLLVYLLAAAAAAPSTPLLVLVLGATTWTGLARIVRAETISLRSSDLCLAGRALGASAPRVLLRHLLPQMGPLLAVSAALRFADTILLESALGFLGLSGSEGSISLGAIVASGREALAGAWWIALWPSAAIAVLALALRASATGLARAADPVSAS